MSTHDPGGIGAGGEHGAEHLASSGRAGGRRAARCRPRAGVAAPAGVGRSDHD